MTRLADKVFVGLWASAGWALVLWGLYDGAYVAAALVAAITATVTFVALLRSARRR